MNLQFKCPHCGDEVHIDDSKEKAFCSNCGQQIPIPHVISNDPAGNVTDHQVEANLRFAREYLSAKKYSDALEHADKALEYDASSEEAWQIKAREAQEMVKKANEEAGRAREEHQASIDGQFMYAFGRMNPVPKPESAKSSPVTVSEAKKLLKAAMKWIEPTTPDEKRRCGLDLESAIRAYQNLILCDYSNIKYLPKGRGGSDMDSMFHDLVIDTLLMDDGFFRKYTGTAGEEEYFMKILSSDDGFYEEFWNTSHALCHRMGRVVEKWLEDGRIGDVFKLLFSCIRLEWEGHSAEYHECIPKKESKLEDWMGYHSRRKVYEEVYSSLRSKLRDKMSRLNCCTRDLVLVKTGRLTYYADPKSIFADLNFTCGHTLKTSEYWSTGGKQLQNLPKIY